MEGIRELGNNGRQREALALQGTYQEACDRLGLGARDRRRVLGELRKVWSAHALGLNSMVRSTLSQVRELMNEELREEFMGRVCWLEAGAALARGDLRQSESSLREAEEHFSLSENEAGLAGTLLRLGTLYREQGRLDEAQESFRRSRELHLRCEDLGGAFAAVRGLSSVHLVRGEPDEAELLLSRAQEWLELGDRDQADIQNLLGEIHRQRKEWDRAQVAYEEAARFWARLGDPASLVARINLGMALVEQGHHQEALDRLEEAADEAGERGFVREQMYAFGGLLPCLAAQGKWLRFCEILGILEAYIQGNAVRSDDLRRMLEQALRLAKGRAPEELESWIGEALANQREIDLDFSRPETKRRDVV